jgi:hypothetical protein
VDEYRTGDDFTLAYLGHRYRFSYDDFASRLADAAVRLGIADSDALEQAEARADLVELATHGRLGTARSALGRHLAGIADASLVYWLRKLVFRSAWVDQRVRGGVIEPVYDDQTGLFSYRLDGHGVPAAATDDVPSFAASGFHRS